MFGEKKKRLVFLSKQQSVRPCAAAERSGDDVVDDDNDDSNVDDGNDNNDIDGFGLRVHSFVHIQAVLAGKSERLKANMA